MVVCCFAGHRIAPENLMEELLPVVERIACSSDKAVFYSGGMGDFDRLCEQAVREIKRKYPQRTISLRLVLPSYSYARKPQDQAYLKELYDDIVVCDASDGAHFKAMIGKRNRWMVDQSDVVLAFVVRSGGGAHQTLLYAQKTKRQIVRVGA